MLISLALPIAVLAVALFFVSFLSWMVVKLHKNDWSKLANEDDLMAALKKLDLPEGSYMFPCAASDADMRSEAFQQRYAAGPRGILTILPRTNMGQNLALNFAFFLAASFGLGLLASMAFDRGAAGGSVFPFVFVAAFMTFLTAMVPQAIWFRARIVGHVIESAAYAAVAAVIFTLLWPAA